MSLLTLPHPPTVAQRPAVDVAERLYTAADLAELPSELPSGPVSHELDNGRLISMPPPGNIHGAVESNLSYELKRQGERAGHGKARGEVGIVLWRNPDRVVGADAAFIAASSLPIRESPEGYLETIPDLVVEVLSRNDRKGYVTRKVEDYLAVGVRQVWIVDPAKRTVTIHRPDVQPQVLSDGDKDVLHAPDIIPDFAMPLSDVFEQ